MSAFQVRKLKAEIARLKQLVITPEEEAVLKSAVLYFMTDKPVPVDGALTPRKHLSRAVLAMQRAKDKDNG